MSTNDTNSNTCVENGKCHICDQNNLSLIKVCHCNSKIHLNCLKKYNKIIYDKCNVELSGGLTLLVMVILELLILLVPSYFFNTVDYSLTKDEILIVGLGMCLFLILNLLYFVYSSIVIYDNRSPFTNKEYMLYLLFVFISRIVGIIYSSIRCNCLNFSVIYIGIGMCLLFCITMITTRIIYGSILVYNIIKNKIIIKHDIVMDKKDFNL